MPAGLCGMVRRISFSGGEPYFALAMECLAMVVTLVLPEETVVGALSAPGGWYPLVDLTAANARAGHDKEAKEAAAQLQKVYPGFTVQTFAGIHWTDGPTFNAQYQRIVEGLRKAGVPEGDKKAD